LRKICIDNPPINNNIFDLCAYYLLQYETTKKENEIIKKSLKALVEENQNGGNSNSNNDIKDGLNINSGIEKALKELNAENYIPKNKIALKSKDLAITKFNLEIDQQHTRLNSRGFPQEKIKLKSIKFVPEKKVENKIFTANNTNNANDINNISITELVKPTTPAKISYSETKMESFELEVDLLNHLSESGGVNSLHYNIINKPSSGENIVNVVSINTDTDKKNVDN
jgi:hypothetical protein